MRTSRALLESVLRTFHTPLLNDIKTTCVFNLSPHLVATPQTFCTKEMRLEMVHLTLVYIECMTLFIFSSSILVAFTPCDDASLKPEAREIVNQAFPSLDQHVLPR